MLSYVLKKAAKLYPNKTAVVCGENRFSYRQFYDRVLRLSGGLQTLGIKKGDRIAVLMPNCHRYLELYHAALKIKAILVPINTRLSGREIAFILKDSEPQLLFSSKEFKNAAFRKKVIIVEEGYEDLLCKKNYIDSEYNDSENDTALLLYTSGTTGEPKGAMITNKALLFMTYHVVINNVYKTSDTFLHLSPMFHLAGLTNVFAPAMTGGSDVIIKKFDPLEVLTLIEKEGITTTVMAPTMINILIGHHDINNFNLSSLRLLAYGGSPISRDLLNKAMKIMKCGFTQGYALTESASLITSLSPDDHISSERILLSCGREAIGMEVRVVNENGEDVKPGEVGEIIARGPTIMKGYWNKPEETAKVLKNGWLYTGDMATVDEGNYIYIVDRKKDMIISGGENIYSTEVEKVLYSHPDILEAAVIGVPDEKWGEAVKAVVVCRNGRSLNEDEIIKFCRERLSGYKCPKSVDFIDSLPKSGSGKILKKILRERYWGGE